MPDQAESQVRQKPGQALVGTHLHFVPTNTAGRQLDFLEARHRAHARVEDRVRTGKTTGLDHLPSTSMTVNAAWCVAAMIATDLLRWFALLCPDFRSS